MAATAQEIIVMAAVMVVGMVVTGMGAAGDMMGVNTVTGMDAIGMEVAGNMIINIPPISTAS